MTFGGRRSSLPIFLFHNSQRTAGRASGGAGAPCISVSSRAPWWPFGGAQDRNVRRGVHYGLFGPAYECARDADVPLVLREALWTEIDWFEANLPVPARGSFLVKSRRRFRPDGICWFTDAAREAIARAFAVAALLRDYGVPVSKVTTHRPGTFLYRDAWQIVAKPHEATPTMWH